MSKTADEIVEALLADVTDRRGWRQAWHGFGPEVKSEILAEWRRIVGERVGALEALASWDGVLTCACSSREEDDNGDKVHADECPLAPRNAQAAPCIGALQERIASLMADADAESDELDRLQNELWELRGAAQRAIKYLTGNRGDVSDEHLPGRLVDVAAVAGKCMRDLVTERDTLRARANAAESALSDVTELLLGERPMGTMPETTVEAARRVAAERGALVARAEQAEREAETLRAYREVTNQTLRVQTSQLQAANGARARAERDQMLEDWRHYKATKDAEVGSARDMYNDAADCLERAANVLGCEMGGLSVARAAARVVAERDGARDAHQEEYARRLATEADLATVTSERDAAHLQHKADLHTLHEALAWAGEWPLNMPPPSRAAKAVLERIRELEAALANAQAMAQRWPEEHARAEKAERELARMKARPAESEFSRLDSMWQALVADRDRAVLSLRRAGWTYTEGAEAWRPPLGPGRTSGLISDAAQCVRGLLALVERFEGVVAEMGGKATFTPEPFLLEVLGRLEAAVESDDAARLWHMVRQYQHRDESSPVATLERLLSERARIADMAPPNEAWNAALEDAAAYYETREGGWGWLSPSSIAASLRDRKKPGLISEAAQRLRDIDDGGVRMPSPPATEQGPECKECPERADFETLCCGQKPPARG